VGRVFNLGSQEVINLKDLAEKLVRINGSGTWEIVPFPPDRVAIDIGDYYGDFGSARVALKWQPKIGLDEGLKRTLDYYRARGSEYWESP